jgi:hypothetical protein
MGTAWEPDPLECMARLSKVSALRSLASA